MSRLIHVSPLKMRASYTMKSVKNAYIQSLLTPTRHFQLACFRTRFS